MRRPVVLIALIVVVVGVAHGLAWRFVAQRLEVGWERFAARQRVLGWTVTYDAPSAGGYPFAATLTVPHLVMAGQSAEVSVPVDWHADRLVLRVALAHPGTLGIDPDGSQSVRVADGPRLPFTAERLHGTVPLDPDAPAHTLDVAGANLRVEIPRGEVPPGVVTVALLSLKFDSHPAATRGEPALAVTASAQDVVLPTLPRGRGWPFGPRIASVSGEGSLDGPMPRDLDPELRAAHWRDGGGTIEIRRFAIGWGALGLSGSATLALDDRLQPMGTGTARLIRPADTVDAMVAEGAMPPGAAVATKAVLGLMTRTPEGGGAPQVEAPLTLQDSDLRMGRIPIARVPALVWPSSR